MAWSCPQNKQLGLNPHLSADEYWEMLFSLKNIADEPLFNNLRKAVYLIFILPFSNACVERIFSQLKLIKTDNRNHLDTDTIAALMMTKQSITSVTKYEPSKQCITSNIKLY